MAKKSFDQVEELKDSAAVFDGLAEAKPKGGRYQKKGARSEPHTRASLWLPVDLLEKIEALAYAEHTRASYLVAQAIEEFIDKPDREKLIKKYARNKREGN